MPSIAYNGNGIYKSIDGGETWNYLALADKGIISKITVHPTNPMHLVVASMGNPYIRDAERGIFVSKDGGTTWVKTLYVSNQAGASDLVMAPSSPNIMYASFWDRIRNNQESILSGPSAKVFKSEDGGISWIQLSNGLPTGRLGRTGLAVSQTNADKLYVVFIDSLSAPQGLYKTTNGGTSFSSVNIASLDDSCGDFGWYFGKIRLNPNNDEDVYFLAILLWRKQAGSSSWIAAGGGHADCHDLVFCPSGRRYWANDGGVYRNDPGQMVWAKSKNLPTTQFYHTTYNHHDPNKYWAGAQDNGIQKGAGGAGYNNWTSVFSADGFRCAFHPTDPATFWVEIQNATIHKTTDGGNSWQFGSPSLGSTDRCNWDAPFFISKFNANKLYSATYRAYISDGNGWASISPDLTDGIILSPRFHTVSCLTESPLVPEKLIAGTSDGNVWRREPTGGWVKINGTLPDRYVTSVHCSPTLPNRLFVTHSGYRDNESIPRIHRSDDNGATWVNISGDLPQAPINDLFVMPGQADAVLFVATDAGVYFTKNFGTNWERLGSNMPVIPVFDLEDNPVKKELVAATFARGIWTMKFDSIFAQSPVPTISITGSITTETGEGIRDVHISNTKTETDGGYIITQVPGCEDYTLIPYRNDNLLNGLTTYDLVLISKHILGIEPLGSPYKMIAADANKSNSITTSDIVSLRKLILGIDTALAGNTSWRFLPLQHQFGNTQNPLLTPFPEKIELQTTTVPLTGNDFIGIKVGDVNGSVAPNALLSNDDRAADEWALHVADQSFEQQEQVYVIIPRQGKDLVSLQFTLSFDPEALQFDRIEPLSTCIGMQHFGIQHLEDGLINMAAEDLKDEPLVRIVFQARKAGRLRDVLKLSDNPTPSLAYRHDGQAFAPVLFEAGQHQATISFSPNPFGEYGTQLYIGMQGKTNAQEQFLLEIFDNQGIRVFKQEITPEQVFVLPAKVFPVSGVYHWQIPTLRQSGKLVFVR
ncbi:MAG: hypothetical protein JNJ57_21690 [Saprospiraceae bacterium]|nr:hypothetical protein [Saprospiraceae bacterium]